MYCSRWYLLRSYFFPVYLTEICKYRPYILQIKIKSIFFIHKRWLICMYAQFLFATIRLYLRQAADVQTDMPEL